MALKPTTFAILSENEIHCAEALTLIRRGSRNQDILLLVSKGQITFPGVQGPSS